MGILDAPGPSKTTIQRVNSNSESALRGLEYQTHKAPLVATPTISFAASNPSSTPTQYLPVTGANTTVVGVANTQNYTFVGGRQIRAGGAYPGYSGIRRMPVPYTVQGKGGSIVEFYSDAPALSFWQQMAELGTFRVLCDGVEVYRCSKPIITGTAQAADATTITLSTTASAANGYYVGRVVRITGGTGSGQTNQINAYVGSTKVATVALPWTTTPDSTSTFEVAYTRRDNSTSNTANPWTTFTWNERRLRRYRFECSGATFFGIWANKIDTVAPATPYGATPTFWVGDSFSNGTYSDGGQIDGLAAIACNRLGWSLVNTSIGGTGYLNPLPGTQNGSLNALDRLFPPTNAWLVRIDGATAGTFTLTQNGTATAAIAYNATRAAVQSAIDAAFGAGAFDVAGDSAAQFWIVGRSAANATAALTADFSGLTGGYTYLEKYIGEIAPSIPKDGNGNALPFNIVLANGHNDTTSTSSAFTTTLLQSQVTNLLNQIRINWPTARVIVIGNMYLPGGNVGADVTAANAAILAACQTALPKINGALPFIDTITNTWIPGTGYLGALAGNGPSDICTDVDGVHPTPYGHRVYGQRIAAAITAILTGAPV